MRPLPHQDSREAGSESTGLAGLALPLASHCPHLIIVGERRRRCSSHDDDNTKAGQGILLPDGGPREGPSRLGVDRRQRQMATRAEPIKPPSPVLYDPPRPSAPRKRHSGMHVPLGSCRSGADISGQSEECLQEQRPSSAFPPLPHPFTQTGCCSHYAPATPRSHSLS